MPVDSGTICFAGPAGVAALADPEGDALDALDAALSASARDTWEHAARDGVLACSAGLGDGLYVVAWGYDAEERLAAVSVELLAEDELAEERPGRGLQRAMLAGAVFGGPEDDPQNLVPLPPAVNRQVTNGERAVLRALLAGQELELSVEPRYEGDSPVPVDVTLTARPVEAADDR